MDIKTIGDLNISVELQQCINADIANHYQVIPCENFDETLSLYISETKANELDSIKQELKLILNKDIELQIIPETSLAKLLSIHYRKGTDSINYARDLQNDFLENLILEAKNIGASDIHIEVYEEDTRVRLRIDGHLIEKNYLKKENYLELINQIKIKSNLDITEKRLPQDGRIEYENFDIRVSILPTHHGEKVVMRILGRDASHLDIKQLGFDDDNLKLYLEAVRKTNGIILISGPTGSGKTTTLYATLKHLNSIKQNIVTVEDPIEYTLKGINQVQLKESIGLTFACALRSFLRQDPDIIMLGEIRDHETAQMAIRASLTGHLVLSTIHTNSSIGTISRLIDMNVPQFLIAETMNISVAQRLLRCLCEHCKEEEVLDKQLLPLSFEPQIEVKNHFVAKGCECCYYTGYKGRKAIYEILPINQEVALQIKNDTIEQSDFLKGHRLSDKAFELLQRGITSLDEVYPILINA
jgi:type IV pilus assembly protein PilB